MRPHRKLCMNIHGSIIHKRQSENNPNFYHLKKKMVHPQNHNHSAIKRNGSPLAFQGSLPANTHQPREPDVHFLIKQV